MDPILTASSEAEAVWAVLLGALGAVTLLAGFWLVMAAPRMRANPGDALLALGAVLCITTGHISGHDDMMLWSAAAVAALRVVFAFGHLVDERHHPTRDHSFETPAQRQARRRRRDRAVAEETIRRYEAAMQARNAQDPEPVDIRSERTDEDIPALPAPVPPEEAHYREIEDSPTPPLNDDEILVRFETPIDAADLDRRPDRARAAMAAIIEQLGQGGRITGIRARR